MYRSNRLYTFLFLLRHSPRMQRHPERSMTNLARTFCSSRLTILTMTSHRWTIIQVCAHRTSNVWQIVPSPSPTPIRGSGVSSFPRGGDDRSSPAVSRNETARVVHNRLPAPRHSRADRIPANPATKSANVVLPPLNAFRDRLFAAGSETDQRLHRVFGSEDGIDVFSDHVAGRLQICE